MENPLDVRDPTALIAEVRLPEGGDPDGAVRAVDEEIERVATDGVPADELRRVVARASAQLHQLADNVMERTLAAASYEQQRGRAELVWEVPEHAPGRDARAGRGRGRDAHPVDAGPARRRPGEPVVSPAARAVAPREVPALAPPRRPRLPRVSERVLPNGLRVVAVRRPAVPLVHVRLRVPTATRRADDLARTELLAHSMLLGTDRRSEEQLAETLQAMGGGLRASGDPDGFTLSGESLAPELGGLLDVLGEVLTGAIYPRRGVERERIAAGRARPAAAARSRRRRRPTPGRHAATATTPTAGGSRGPRRCSTIAPGSLRGAHGAGSPRTAVVLVLVGDVVPARALDLVERHLGGWAPDRAERRRAARCPCWRPVHCCWSTGPARCRPTSASAGTRLICPTRRTPPCRSRTRSSPGSSPRG